MTGYVETAAAPNVTIRRANFPPAGRAGGNRRSDALFMAACAALAVIGLLSPLTGLLARVSADYGEGFNAYWAAAAMQGPAALYSPAHVMVANNYPPLSFYLVGLLGRIVGDNIFAGRIVALAAMIATAILSGRIVTLLGAPRRWGWITGLLLLACAEHLFGHFVAVDNPQWLAQAIMLAAMIPLVRRPCGPTPADCLASGAAIVLALLVKHNLFAFPLAGALWLARYHRRSLPAWALSIAAFAALAGAGLYALYGRAVFVEILAFDRTADWRNFIGGLIKSESFIPMLLVAAAVAGRRRHDVRWVLFAAAGLLGLMLGIVQRMGAGVYINAHFEALVALVIVTGQAFGVDAGWRPPFGSARWRAALLGVVLIPMAISLPHQAREWAHQIATRGATRQAWAETIADVRARPGTVICEVPAMCYWAGKPFVVDFFAFGQRYRKRLQPHGLDSAIAAQRIDLIILDRSYVKAKREPRLPPPFPGLFDRAYRTVRVIPPDDIDELVPRGASPPPLRTLALS